MSINHLPLKEGVKLSAFTDVANGDGGLVIELLASALPRMMEMEEIALEQESH